MAGDWIKMRGNLWDDPRVAKLCDITDQGEAAIIGGLYWLWSTADQHTEDGVMPGLTLRAIDRKTGVPGLADALIEIGWIADHPGGVCIINFEEHNGASAKRRSLDAQRKANVRSVSASNADNVQTNVGQDAPSCGAREEKRREDISSTDVEEKRSPRSRPAVRPEDVPESVWTDFQALRKTKRAPLTTTALEGIAREAAKASMSLADVLALCCTRGWQGFKADWVANAKPTVAMPQSTGETAYQRNMRLRVAEIAPGIARKDPALATQDAADYFRTIDITPEVPAIEVNK